MPSEPGGAGGSPEEAARAFLLAFDRLEWDQFRSYFADDMTMFFPFAHTPARVDGREAIEKVFETFFRAKRQQLADAGLPMTQGLNPRDTKVQLAGTDAAVVTFHLGEESPRRRSLVLRRTSGGWKVIHWHASSIGTAAAAQSVGGADSSLRFTALEIRTKHGVAHGVTIESRPPAPRKPVDVAAPVHRLRRPEARVH